MSCTPTSRPSGRYYISLITFTATLAFFISIGAYVEDTRSKLTELSASVDAQGARIASIPEFIYDMEKELNIEPAAGKDSVAPADKSDEVTYTDVTLRACAARNASDKSTALVSASLAHLVGKEVYIPEVEYTVTVVNLERGSDFAPAIRICMDEAVLRVLDDTRVSVRVKK